MSKVAMATAAMLDARLNLFSDPETSAEREEVASTMRRSGGKARRRVATVGRRALAPPLGLCVVAKQQQV